MRVWVPFVLNSVELLVVSLGLGGWCDLWVLLTLRIRVLFIDASLFVGVDLKF